MISWPWQSRCGPIGIDIGSRSVKLAQFSADRDKLIDVSRWDLPEDDVDPTSPAYAERLSGAIERAREGRKFLGSEAAICLSHRELFLQNLRIPKVEGEVLERMIEQEAAGRVPYPLNEIELRHIEAAEVRQGGERMREVILLACHRPQLERLLGVVERAGLTPVGVEIEPSAMLRSYIGQFRRSDEQQQRALFVHIGYSRTAAVVAEGEQLLFIKYIDVGGRQLDEAVGRSLKMKPEGAAALRQNNGDRRADRQDPEVARSITSATRPVLDKLAQEISLCVRYHSVTFRGKPLVRMVVGGGEASPQLLETLRGRVNLKCELSDPFRRFEAAPELGRQGQWDIATGLALRPAMK